MNDSSKTYSFPIFCLLSRKETIQLFFFVSWFFGNFFCFRRHRNKLVKSKILILFLFLLFSQISHRPIFFYFLAKKSLKTSTLWPLWPFWILVLTSSFVSTSLSRQNGFDGDSVVGESVSKSEVAGSKPGTLLIQGEAGQLFLEELGVSAVWSADLRRLYLSNFCD